MSSKSKKAKKKGADAASIAVGAPSSGSTVSAPPQGGTVGIGPQAGVTTTGGNANTSPGASMPKKTPTAAAFPAFRRPAPVRGPLPFAAAPSSSARVGAASQAAPPARGIRIRPT